MRLVCFGISDRKQEAAVTDLISNLGKSSNYSSVTPYQMGEAYDGLYSASYQFPGCFYSSSPYYRYALMFCAPNFSTNNEFLIGLHRQLQSVSTPTMAFHVPTNWITHHHRIRIIQQSSRNQPNAIQIVSEQNLLMRRRCTNK